MCHHYRTREARKLGLKPEWDNEFSVKVSQYQLALPDTGFWPMYEVPIVRLDKSGERELVPAQLGFLPFWWNPSDKAPKCASFQRKCINACSEDVHTKPSFREAFKRRR